MRWMSIILVNILINMYVVYFWVVVILNWWFEFVGYYFVMLVFVNVNKLLCRIWNVSNIVLFDVNWKK